MVLAVLAILAVIIIPTFADVAHVGRAKTMSTIVRHIRELIAYKVADPEVVLSDAGYPVTIETSWFARDKLPYHTWTGNPLVVETVAGPAGDIYPAEKTFSAGDPNAWYNNSNGAFCVRVPASGTVAKTLENFNTVNACNVVNLNQTTH